MKKLITSIFLLGIVGFAQGQNVISSGIANPPLDDFANEIKLNFLNLIVLGSVELGYERYLSSDYSVEFQAHINDRFGYNSQSDGKNFNTNALQLSMNFYFGGNSTGRGYLFPFAKYRFGDFEEGISNDAGTTQISTDMNAFMLGIGGGYKWELSENFAFGPYISIARGFSEPVAERFSRVELNGGFALGYRF